MRSEMSIVGESSPSLLTKPIQARGGGLGLDVSDKAVLVLLACQVFDGLVLSGHVRSLSACGAGKIDLEEITPGRAWERLRGALAILLTYPVNNSLGDRLGGVKETALCSLTLAPSPPGS